MSVYAYFERADWKRYREQSPLLLNEAELETLRGFNEPLSLSEVEDIYLPLSRLLNLYISQTQSLHQITNAFLYHQSAKMPYVIGISGSVAVGKSTTSRILQTLLSRWPNHPRVALVSTDGFLYPNAVLEKRNLMHRKGFPESYDRAALIHFLTQAKSGAEKLSFPTYSHAIYDITQEKQTITSPDILIIEGLNILQAPDLKGTQKTYVSDFVDFSIFVDAPTSVIKNWFLERFRAFRENAQHRPDLFFYQFAQMPETEALLLANQVWDTINQPNLVENILPYKHRAQLILEKASNHEMKGVYLRRL